jgi:excisionase family DNA binding protein
LSPKKGGVMNNELNKPYLSLEEAANYLSLKKSTIYQYTSKNLIPHYKFRRRILFKISELNEFIEECRVKTNAEIETEAITNIVTGK